jgi:hypothetical protein
MKNKNKNKVFYTLLNRDGREVQIDLNNYKVTCTITGNRKAFYHKYLAGLIERDYDNNIDTFRTTYVSREAKKADSKQKKVDQIQDRISRAYDLIATLKSDLVELTQNNS